MIEGQRAIRRGEHMLATRIIFGTETFGHLFDDFVNINAASVACAVNVT
jgi:hypothetical protein